MCAALAATLSDYAITHPHRFRASPAASRSPPGPRLPRRTSDELLHAVGGVDRVLLAGVGPEPAEEEVGDAVAGQEGVVAVVAEERIPPQASPQRVVPGAPVELVVAGATDERVV